MKADCIEYARKYDKCQRFALISKAHSEELTSMTSSWPLVVWGIDLIGRLPKGRGSVQYAVVVVNYFTKWVEAKAVTSITPIKIKEFIYKNIVYQEKGHPRVGDHLREEASILRRRPLAPHKPMEPKDEVLPVTICRM